MQSEALFWIICRHQMVLPGRAARKELQAQSPERPVWTEMSSWCKGDTSTRVSGEWCELRRTLCCPRLYQGWVQMERADCFPGRSQNPDMRMNQLGYTDDRCCWDLGSADELLSIMKCPPDMFRFKQKCSVCVCMWGGKERMCSRSSKQQSQENRWEDTTSQTQRLEQDNGRGLGTALQGTPVDSGLEGADVDFLHVTWYDPQ